MKLEQFLGFAALLAFTGFLAFVNSKSGSRFGKKTSFVVMWIMIIATATYLGVALW